MATTVEAVVNAALSYIGLRDPILDINEPSVPAEVAKIHFDSSRRQVLGERWWNFATASAPLARLNITAPTGWLYAYQPPTDLLPGKQRYIANSVRPALVPRNSQIAFSTFWVAGSGQVIVTDHTAPALVYTRDVVELIYWPESVLDALAWNLAPKLALGLSVDLNKGISFSKQYLMALDKGMAEDMNSVRTDPPIASQFESGRS